MFDVRAEARTLQNFKIALPLFIAFFIFREQVPFTIPLHNFPHGYVISIFSNNTEAAPGVTDEAETPLWNCCALAYRCHWFCFRAND
jgi:hypothetical protein